MTDARVNESDRKRGARRWLLALLLLLLLVFAAVLYVLFGMLEEPGTEPVLSDQPGIEYVWSTFGGSFGTISRPMGVAYDGIDSIYVTESVRGRVTVFDINGENGRVFLLNEGKDDDVSYPVGIDVADDGSIYIADPENNAVAVYDDDGDRLRTLAFEHKPMWVTVAGERLYTTDDGTLYVSDLQGNELARWGTFGRAADQLSVPGGVAVDGDGNVFIADTNNYRVVALTPDFDPLWQVGQAAAVEAEAQNRELGGPSGVALAEDGNLYFLDALNSQINVIDAATGQYASQPLSGQGNTDDSLYLPRTIDSIGGGLFVVADMFHDRIVCFRVTPQP